MAERMPETISRRAVNGRPSAPAAAAFKAILAEDIDWKPFAAFPPSARLAVIVGQPSEPGLYTIRVKLPHDMKLMRIRPVL